MLWGGSPPKASGTRQPASTQHLLGQWEVLPQQSSQWTLRTGPFSDCVTRVGPRRPERGPPASVRDSLSVLALSRRAGPAPAKAVIPRTTHPSSRRPCPEPRMHAGARGAVTVPRISDGLRCHLSSLSPSRTPRNRPLSPQAPVPSGAPPTCPRKAPTPLGGQGRNHTNLLSCEVAFVSSAHPATRPRLKVTAYRAASEALGIYSTMSP